MDFSHLRRPCFLALAIFILLAAACTPQPAPEQTGAPSPAATDATPTQGDSTAAPPQPATDPQVTAPETRPPAAPVRTVAPQSRPAAGPQLAFLHAGDIWLLDEPTGDPYQLTLAGDITSFAWAPDGERLAAFNGKALCFFQRDGSVRSACMELGLTEDQATIERKILWAPDQTWIVLWNAVNPWDEDSIGWLAVALDTTNAMWRIQDPVDWGAALAPNNEPGGITGQPLFLPDGRLIGTLSHRYLCASGGCRYQLFEFDLRSLTPRFTAFPNQPEEGWSEGRNLILSPDGATLTNYGAFQFSCDSYQTFIDRYTLATAGRETFSLEKQAVVEMSFSPDESQAVLARTAGCSEPEQSAWNQTCGLSQGFEVFSMQLWSPGEEAGQELPAGLAPAWSPQNGWIAFNSCLKESAAGEWQPDETQPASIYLVRPGDDPIFVSEGKQPAWRPE